MTTLLSFILFQAVINLAQSFFASSTTHLSPDRLHKRYEPPEASFVTMPSSDEEFQPEKKKAKTKDSSDEEDNEEETEVKRNDSGEAYFEIGNAKRVTVRQWKKAVLVDIREFYEKNGKDLPGKKGISLTLEQYKALKKHIMDGSLDEQVKKLEK